MSDIANKLLFFLPIVQIQLSFETIQELIFTEPEWLRSKSNYIIYKISKQKCWQSIYKRRMRDQSTHRKIWQQEADGWMDVYHIKNNVGEPLIINLKNNDGQLINMLKSISSKADNSRTKELWRHPKDKENKALPHFSSRWTWGTLWFKIQNCRCFQFWITPKSLSLKHIHKKTFHLLMQSCMQCQCVEGCGSVLTVMTDTPAAVLLSLGTGLKCFLIFPATGSWCSFSDTPSSWKIQRTKLQQLYLWIKLHILSQQYLYVHRRFWWKDWLQHAELTLTHGLSSTCTAVYLWSTSTCSIPVIRA